MERIDTLVIGAGVAGLACARALAQSGHETFVLEREGAIGMGVSSRNSEVIHAGLYYPTGSLKAGLCVRGRQLLYPFCAQHGVAHRRTGKLVVATDEAQLASLDRIARQAHANGVPVQWLEAHEAQALEPELQCRAALLSPETGIVDSHGLLLALQGDLEAAGGGLALDSAFETAAVTPEGIIVTVRSGEGEVTEWLVQRLVNAAGLYACAVAGGISGLDHSILPRAHYAKGSYFSLSGKSPFSRLIYPAPQDAWLGVHLTLDLGGQARFGPDHQWLDVSNPLDIDYRVQAERAEGFYAEVRRYWPQLPDGALQAAYSGVRPKIHGPGEPAPDFRIDGPAQHGVPGLVNLMGIESPGLTSALAIGEHVAGLLA